MSDIIFSVTSPQGGDPAKRLAGLVEHVRTAQSGERNDRLNAAAYIVATDSLYFLLMVL